jgi:hypothetical protein
MTEREFRAAHEWQSLYLAKAALDARVRAAQPVSAPTRRRLRLPKGWRKAALVALGLVRRAWPRWTLDQGSTTAPRSSINASHRVTHPNDPEFFRPVFTTRSRV